MDVVSTKSQDGIDAPFLSWQVSDLKQRNKQLQTDLLKRRAQRRELQGRVMEAHSHHSEAAIDHTRLQAEVHRIRRSLEVVSQCILLQDMSHA